MADVPFANEDAFKVGVEQTDDEIKVGFSKVIK